MPDSQSSESVPRIIGTIIAGSFDEIVCRKKNDLEVEIGELVVAEPAKDTSQRILLQVTDVRYASQLSVQNMELVAGMHLEDDTPLTLLDANVRAYELLALKPLVTLESEQGAGQGGKGALALKARPAKSLPGIFSPVRAVQESDLTFFNAPTHPLQVGHLRSGSKTLKTPIYLNGLSTFSHHVLIAGTTGKGKSVLMSDMLWNAQDQGFVSLLVLDPHDEYYGRTGPGLKDHPAKKVIYYTARSPPPGARTLKINLHSLKVEHFDFLDLSPPQRQAIYAYARQYKDAWIEAIVLEKPIELKFNDATLAVLKRRMVNLLDIDFVEDSVKGRGVFDFGAGESTVQDICLALESGKSVVIDTSAFSGQVELLIGSVVSHEMLNKYKQAKLRGELAGKPVVSIVLEEAPRVLGKEVLASGSNVYAQVCREGRKFNVGLVAITQLPSLIPKELLANMNTKIILGIEMASERQAIIESASQDLGSDGRMIASLAKGEAIITSSFLPFALPLSIPFFPDVVAARVSQDKGAGKAAQPAARAFPELKR